VYHSLLRSRTNPRAYVVEESRRSGVEAHQSSPFGNTYFPKMRAIIDITVEY